ncbi:hypothetical protein [Dyella sp. 2RAB6]|uniref:hypothetical protein n=1 Tax=Dyella sp. 2RAB6 TaxID=3232992 RepID=UPI003F907204
MHRPSRPWLTQLRRYRGLWLLAVFALMIKLVGGSLCASDGLRYAAGTDAQRSSMVQSMTAATADEGSGDCVLGEGSSCHCACTHAVPLPAMMTLHVAANLLPSELPSASFGHRAEPTATLLRPPIAA